jgi:hypothetical protein
MSLSNINNGLVFAASPTLPEYPDNAAGTTYRNVPGWTTGVDGFTSAGTVSVSGGRLLWAKTAAGNELSKTITIDAGRTIRIKFKFESGAPSANVLNIRVETGGGIAARTINSAIGVENTVDVTSISSRTSFSMYFGSAGSSELYSVSFEFIYIGDGTYSSRLLDASGNGNHGTVFGATPTADGGLSFDKINDTVRIANFAMPNIYTFHADFINNLRDANLQVFHGSGGGSGTPRLTLYRNANSENLIILWFNGTSGQATTINNVFSNTANESVKISFTINWITGVFTLNRNGALFSTVTLTGAVKPDTSTLFFGNQLTLLSEQSYGGILKNIRIYNRALTAAEIEALATNPDAYNLDRVVRSITPVPGSVMTRDINGDTQVRRLESTIATGTAPLTVASTTLVTNLNADRVDGLEGSDFVRGTGTVSQTITGVKTFSSIPVLPASDPTTVNQATRKAYIDGKLPGKITISASAPTGGTDGDIWITV